MAIAIGYRAEESRPEIQARVHYSRIDGSREEKLQILAAITSLEDVEWRDCFTGWTEPLLPASEGNFFSWPLLTDLFPWQHSGIEFKRTWPIAAGRDSLERRWEDLMSAKTDERRELFRETPDRRISSSYSALIDGSSRLTPIGELPDDTPPPPCIAFGYRALDRQFCFADVRLTSRPRPALWRTISAQQLFITSLLTGLLGGGPATIVTHLIPDRHHFRGSFGGKDVIPLWRDAECTQPNITAGLLDTLGDKLGATIPPEDLLAYCYALLSAPSYTRRYREELEIPGPHVPITSEPRLFRKAVSLGRELVWLHTYGERFVPPGQRAGRVPQGQARYEKTIPQRADAYPEKHSYDEARHELRVGEGVFAPVSPDVRAFQVSGLDVIGSWLDYRMKGGAGRKSSPLDDIRPAIWPEAFSKELLELLWVLERTVALGPDLDSLLDNVVSGETIPATELPQPSEAERKPPS
ncbi:MAG: type ISP restriction/modification enzyme [Gaiellaceae bacterium]